ncbi:MAG: glycosyltransferase family 87 protein, partial [Candidatus Acidiferrales bacterium]
MLRWCAKGRRHSFTTMTPRMALSVELVTFRECASIMCLTSFCFSSRSPMVRFVPAFVAWTLLCVAMLGGVILLMANLRTNRSSFAFKFLTVLAFFPAPYCLITGQDSILLLTIFALSFWFLRRGKDDAGGFVLALGLFRPQLVLPFIFVMFLAGRWRCVRGFIPGAALVFALSTSVVGVHGMASYVRMLLSLGTEKSTQVLADRWTIQPEKMATWRGFLT